MSLCFYYQQIYNIMKYNLFDNFYEVIEVIYNFPDNLEKRANRTDVYKRQGVLIVRKTMPDAPRSFKTPLVPFVPIAGIITCLVMMLFLPADTWIRLVLWMLIGLDIYVCYGIKHSKLEHMQKHRSGQTTLDMIGITLSVLCVITGLWHQQTVGWGESKVLLIISFVFAFTHLAFYLYRLGKQFTSLTR